MNDIGAKLKEIREAKGFPQKLIAEVLGIQRASVSRIESNYQKITAEQLQLFCEYCDVSADYILGIPGNKKVFSFQDMESILQKIEELKDALRK